MSLIQNKTKDHIRFCSQDSQFIQVGTNAERLTAAYLADNLNPKTVGDYQILVNYNLPFRNPGGRGNLEIDILLINKFGVFAIEVKDWHGAIEAHDGFWYQLSKSDGIGKYKHKDIFSTLLHKGRVLHSRLSTDFEQLNKLSVIGLISLFRGKKNFKNFSRYPDDAVCGLDNDLLIAVSSTNLLHYGKDSRILTDEEIKKIADSLYNNRSEDRDAIISHYRILDQLSSGHLFESFEAVDTSIPERQVRIKVFEIPPEGASGLDLSKSFYAAPELRSMQRLAFEEIVKRDSLVDTQLGSHPNILKIYEFFQDSGNPYKFYEITEPIRGERLDEIMDRYKGSIPYNIQLDCIEQLCSALLHIHSKNIFHRMISPEVVYIEDDRKVKLADFDLAKVVGVGVPSVTIPQVIVPSVTETTDIYSLGALWFTLAIHPRKVSEITERDLGQLPLDDGAKNLIRRMTAKLPGDRPQKIDKVLKQLGALNKNTNKLDTGRAI